MALRGPLALRRRVRDLEQAVEDLQKHEQALGATVARTQAGVSALEERVEALETVTEMWKRDVPKKPARARKTK